MIRHLGHDPDLKHLLPIDAEGRGLYDKVKDGILFWYLISLIL
jgi:plastin-3